MEGIVYVYKSPSNKYYVGQTFKENKRRNVFKSSKRYAGEKIDNARAKYGPENFIYEVLFRQEFSSFEEGYSILDKWEIYYINKYDSYKNGYNMTLGGSRDFRGHKASDEFKEKCKKRMLENNTFKGKKHTDETKTLISYKNTKFGVIMIDKNTDKPLKEFRNASEACEFLGLPNKARNDIYKVCKKYISPKSGKRYITAHGYK